MNNELELWRFVSENLSAGVILLVVAESSGSSPGRAGFKMAVAADAMCGSIGGGVMEVRLVDEVREGLRIGRPAGISRQVHRENTDHPSGMICSGEQTVIFLRLGPADSQNVNEIVSALEEGGVAELTVTREGIGAEVGVISESDIRFEAEEHAFRYRETLGRADRLYIVGGGHCALELSAVMSKLGFRISLFDDRSELNTIEKNTFADEITLLENYEGISELIPSGVGAYVVVMTIGYKFDDLVIRKLLRGEFRYLGVLGSKAKMAVLLRDLRKDGFPEDQIAAIRTPIGLPINSRTPEEIAISIAAEIIAVRNST